mmetsp:Transcript_112998/g.221537  ORF Transcript_112998/g.221537 Transcript_112998/m.221537 type:complete len:289 (+) Transcript_112998:3-869(+)
MLKKYRDFTTMNPAQSLYDGDGNILTEKLASLTRTYAPAIAGMPSKMYFDPSTADFELSFTAEISDMPTVIYLHEELHYPSGFISEAEPPACFDESQSEPNYLTFQLRPLPGCLGALAFIRVRRNATRAAPEAWADGSESSKSDSWLRRSARSFAWATQRSESTNSDRSGNESLPGDEGRSWWSRASSRGYGEANAKAEDVGADGEDRQSATESISSDGGARSWWGRGRAKVEASTKPEDKQHSTAKVETEDEVTADAEEQARGTSRAGAGESGIRGEEGDQVEPLIL